MLDSMRVPISLKYPGGKMLQDTMQTEQFPYLSLEFFSFRTKLNLASLRLQIFFSPMWDHLRTGDKTQIDPPCWATNYPIRSSSSQHLLSPKITERIRNVFKLPIKLPHIFRVIMPCLQTCNTGIHICSLVACPRYGNMTVQSYISISAIPLIILPYLAQWDLRGSKRACRLTLMLCHFHTLMPSS